MQRRGKDVSKIKGRRRKEAPKEKDIIKEDRSDRRQVVGAAQQERLVEKREEVKEKPFESSGNDVLGGGMRLGAFEPS